MQMNGGNIFNIFFYGSSRILGNASKENLSPMAFQKVILTTCPCCCLKICCKGIDISGCCFHKWCCRFCIQIRTQQVILPSGIAFGWFIRRSHVRVFPYDHFYCYLIQVALNVKFMKQSITIFSLTILFLGTTTPASLSAMKRRDLTLVNPWN